MFSFYDALESIRQFVASGGPVLYGIGALTFFMWTLVFERIWYFRFALPADVSEVVNTWEQRAERVSWNAKQVRRALVSRTREKIEQNLSLIKVCVSLCPLLGLLGTVTGMIVVFHVMAVTGGGDARSMAGGVSRATIPTMAGMVAAISGVFANIYVARTASHEMRRLEDRLTTDH
jgi:biopolymer transport protein ExbB